MGTCRNKLPRCVLAEHLLHGVAFTKRSFDFFQGKHLKACDTVLERDLMFELGFVERGDCLTLAANR